jgi:serine/threonine-protein kinase
MPTHNEPDPTVGAVPPERMSAEQRSEATILSEASLEDTEGNYRLEAGQIIAARYLLEKEIARGGFGIVFLTRDQQLLSKLVVLKVLRANMLENDYVLQKFRQEVEALTRLDHPGIVGVLDTGTLPDGNPFIVMQYIEGGSLRNILSSQGIEFERAAHIIRTVGRALTFAHEKGILHRDLKPENIMLQSLANDEQPKIIDFGIARVKDSQIAPETTTDIAVGTVSYMSPEQLNRHPLGPTSDVYALGVIAYEMLTGRHPFNPETVFQMSDLQRAGLRVAPTALRPSLPVAAETAIGRALSYDPGQRFQNARDFGDTLADALTANSFSTSKPLAQQETQKLEDEIASVPSGSVRNNVDVTRLPHGAPSPAPPKNKINPVWIAVPLALILVAAAAIWYVKKQNPASPSPQMPGPAAVNTPERQLDFSLVLQRMVNGRPLGKPKQATGQEMYDNGDQFWMTLTSPQDGYLYIINEGSQPREGLPSYNVLYPLGHGPATVAANQRIETPSRNGNGYFFDDKPGMEKMWLVFSANAVPELEAAKNAANTLGVGEIQDAAVVRGLQNFFVNRPGETVTAERDDQNELTRLKRKGDILVHQAQLKHH